MKNFECRSRTAGEAVSLYKGGQAVARLSAGGTELMNGMRSGMLQPERVVDLKYIKELDFMKMGPDSLRMGALFCVRDAECSMVLRQSRFNVLSHAAGTLGFLHVRNKATTVGQDP
jgi:CO/xanthine dehydrogenase FAD-binding subunit